MIWWVLTSLSNSRAWTTLYTVAWTNRPAHLFMAWANYKPARRKVYKTVRGVSLHCGYRWIWDTPNIAEQTEPGDTYTHTFLLGGLNATDHIWYYLFSLAPDLARQCQGPLIHISPPEAAMPSARIRRTAPLPLTAAGEDIIPFQAELWDDANFWDPAPNPTRLTAPIAGLYIVAFTGQLSGHVGAAWASFAIRVNAGPNIVHHSHYFNAGFPWAQTIALSTLWKAAAGDFFEVSVRHDAAPPLSLIVVPNDTPQFAMAFLG